MVVFRANNHRKLGSFSLNVLNVRNVRLERTIMHSCNNTHNLYFLSACVIVGVGGR